MANTIIQLKKSGLTGNTPSSLNYGELALNYADGKLFYKNSLGSIVSLTAGLATYSFSTINASSTLILAGSSSDTLSFAGANGVTITGNTSSKTVTVGLNTSLVTANLSNYQSVTNTTTGTWYPALYNATSGNLAVNANNAFTFDVTNAKITTTAPSTTYTATLNSGGGSGPSLQFGTGGNLAAFMQISPRSGINIIDNYSRDFRISSTNISDILYANNSTGNIGIGTNVPQYKLDVAGTANTGALTVSSLNIVGPSANQIFYEGTSGVASFIAAPTQNNTFLNYRTGTGFSWQTANSTSVGNANVSTYQTVTNATTGTWYPALYNGTSGDRQVNANNALSFNSATGGLSATSFNASGITQSNFTDSSGVSTSNQTIKINNGTNWLAFQANASGGSYNGITTTGDVALWFSNGSGTSSVTPGNLVIAPWAGFNFGLRLNSAANTVAVTGSLTSTANITASSGTISASRLTSTVATGIAPLTVTSTTLVSNLNADYLDSQHGSYYSPLTLAQAAYDTANSKTYTFEQNTAPTTSNTSDLWVNTDTGYVYQNFGNTSLPIWAEFGPTGVGTGSPGSINATEIIATDIYSDSLTTSSITTASLTVSSSSLALGVFAGQSTQGTDAIAIGTGAGQYNQGVDAIAIGASAGVSNQGSYSVAIGANAGTNDQPANSIMINASDVDELNGVNAGLYINPVRQDTSNVSNKVYYNPTSKEITYSNTFSPGQVIKDTMLSNSEVTVVSTTIAATGSNVNFITYNYTPVSSSSYLVIHIHISRYEPQGTTDDSWYSVLSVGGTEISYGWQMVNDNGTGTSGRSGVLFPLTGRYTNSSTSSKQIQVAARRDTADDSIIITNSATGIWLRITEIAR